MGATPLLSITGRVLEISKGYIPRVDVAKIVSQEGNITITMDVHKDIRIFDEGDTIELALFNKEPEYEYGKDLCAKATIVAVRDIDDKTIKMTLSIGGLLLIIQGSKEVISKESFKPLMELYVRIKKL